MGKTGNRQNLKKMKVDNDQVQDPSRHYLCQFISLDAHLGSNKKVAESSTVARYMRADSRNLSHANNSRQLNKGINFVEQEMYSLITLLVMSIHGILPVRSSQHLAAMLIVDTRMFIASTPREIQSTPHESCHRVAYWPPRSLRTKCRVLSFWML